MTTLIAPQPQTNYFGHDQATVYTSNGRREIVVTDADDEEALRRQGMFALADVGAADLTISGDFTVSGSATVTGSAQVDADLSVSGDSTVSGSATVDTDLAVGGGATVTGSADIDTNLSVGGSATVTGSATVSTDLSVTGDIATDLPTVDPAVAGELWSDTGTVKVSAGA